MDGDQQMATLGLYSFEKVYSYWIYWNVAALLIQFWLKISILDTSSFNISDRHFFIRNVQWTNFIFIKFHLYQISVNEKFKDENFQNFVVFLKKTSSNWKKTSAEKRIAFKVFSKNLHRHLHCALERTSSFPTQSLAKSLFNSDSLLWICHNASLFASCTHRILGNLRPLFISLARPTIHSFYLSDKLLLSVEWNIKRIHTTRPNCHEP